MDSLFFYSQEVFMKQMSVFWTSSFYRRSSLLLSKSSLHGGFLSSGFRWYPQPPQSRCSFVEQGGFRALSRSK